MREQSKATATCKLDFAAWMKENHTCMAKISAEHQISVGALRRCKAGQTISIKNATQMAALFEKPVDAVFEIHRDMTPLSPVTIHTYHRTLSAVFFRAVKWGYIPENPAARADLPSLAGRHASYLDEADARRLLELLQDEPIKWRAVVSFDLMSGLRRGELLGLRWDDVDLDRQQIYVRQTWNYIKARGCFADTPKNRSSERPLRISRTAVLILLEYKAWQDQRREQMGDAWMDQDNRIFTRDDGQPIFPDSITQWFHKFVQRSGLPDIHIHSLRHTYASLMIADGTPLVVVSHNLGHAQVSTTSNIYSHVIASAEAQADQVFDRYADTVQGTKKEGGQASA
jgi:integrase